MFDTHCHLDADLGEPLEDALDAARRRGVVGWLLPAVAPGNWDRCRALAAEHPGVRLALGIHPQAVRELGDDEIDAALDALPDALDASGAVAVGEVGLDHVVDREPAARARQVRVLRRQLDIALAVGLPPLIHCLRAQEAVFRIWSDHPVRGRLPGVMHAYTGSAEWVPRWVEGGMYVSLCGNLTWVGARRAPLACAVVPAERLLLETDAPYQPPHPLEGRPNRPERLVEVAAAAARIRGVSLAELAGRTTENALRLFEVSSVQLPQARS